MPNQIVIADLGTGNLRSVKQAIDFVSDGISVRISHDPNTILQSSHFILPGQGAIGTWVKQLNANETLKDAIQTRLASGPVLGICLGLQALLRDSEENGGTDGLNILSGSVKHFANHTAHNNAKLKVPHMGWNNVEQVNDHPLWAGIKNKERFYFVHSYYVDSNNEKEIMGQCHYGNSFTAAAATDNLFATHFHPEKSHHAGLQLLKNFVNWNGCT